MKQEYYIGLDLAMEVSVACVVDKEGRTIQQCRFVTEEATLRGFLESVPRPRHFVVEESSQAEWVLGIAKEVCNSAKICKGFKQGSLSGERKGDDNDAYNLAQKLRTNDIVEVWHDGGERRKDLIQYALTYEALVKECTREKNRICAIFRSEGIRGVAKDAYDPSTRETAIAKLPLEGQRQRARAYGALLDQATTLRKKAWSGFYKEVKKYALFKRLLQTPAFGKVSAALVATIVWEPDRFKNTRRFWSYCGFSLRTEDTGEYYYDKKSGKIERKGKKFVLGLTREHHRTLKCIFKRAALTLRRKAWHDEFQRLRSQGVSTENATLTLARKVAALALHFAKHGGTYDETKVFVAHHRSSL